MNMKKILAALSAAVICASAAALPTGAEFVTENGKTYYTDDSGKKLTGIQTVDGKKYYFRKDGSMYKGMLKLKSGKTMLFRSGTGEAATGWVRIDDEKYYFDENGYMLTGNSFIGDKIYKFEDTGELIKQSKNELIEVDGKLYHTEKNGKLSSGITKVKNEYYYFGKDGYAISCTVTEDGYIYEFDCDEGLVSKTEIVTDYSDIKIKVGSFVKPRHELIRLQGKEQRKGQLHDIQRLAESSIQHIQDRKRLCGASQQGRRYHRRDMHGKTCKNKSQRSISHRQLRLHLRACL